MSTTTGPVLLTGAITIVNRTVFNGQPMNWRIPIATGFTALAFNALERIMPEAARILAYTAVATVMLTRVDPDVPSPIESAARWWQEGNQP